MTKDIKGTILVMYYSRNGATRQLAELIAEGIESIPGATARIRTVPTVSATSEATEAERLGGMHRFSVRFSHSIWQYGICHEVFFR
jgi:menaquinone-dependent protoporphyrinogen IX oxidase